VFAWYNHKQQSSEMTKEIFMYDPAELIPQNPQDPWNKNKRQKLDVQGTVIKVYNANGKIPTTKIGRRAARRNVIEGYRIQRIQSKIKQANA
jgi:hypothetical protein